MKKYWSNLDLTTGQQLALLVSFLIPLVGLITALVKGIRGHNKLVPAFLELAVLGMAFNAVIYLVNVFVFHME